MHLVGFILRNLSRRTVTWTSNIMSVWLWYPACKSHYSSTTLNCFMNLVWLYNIFHRYFQKRYDFRENYIEQETCVLIFSTDFVWNISCLRIVRRGKVNSFHSSGGVLSNVARRCVWSRNLMNGGDRGPRWSAPPQGKKVNLHRYSREISAILVKF